MFMFYIAIGIVVALLAVCEFSKRSIDGKIFHEVTLGDVMKGFVSIFIWPVLTLILIDKNQHKILFRTRRR